MRYDAVVINNGPRDRKRLNAITEEIKPQYSGGLANDDGDVTYSTGVNPPSHRTPFRIRN